MRAPRKTKLDQALGRRLEPLAQDAPSLPVCWWLRCSSEASCLSMDSLNNTGGALRFQPLYCAMFGLHGSPAACMTSTQGCHRLPPGTARNVCKLCTCKNVKRDVDNLRQIYCSSHDHTVLHVAKHITDSATEATLLDRVESSVKAADVLAACRRVWRYK